MTIIDCNTCPVRDQHCSSCFVPIVAGAWLRHEIPQPGIPAVSAGSTSTWSGPGQPSSAGPTSAPLSMPLSDEEWDAVDVFIGAGLVNALDVLEVVATPDTSVMPGWRRVS